MENNISADAFNGYKDYISERVGKLAEEGKNVKYWERIKNGFDAVSKSSFAVSVGSLVGSLAMIYEANKHVIDPAKPLSENFGMLVATSLGALAIAGISKFGQVKSESVYQEKSDIFKLKEQKEQKYLDMFKSPADTVKSTEPKNNKNSFKM